MAKAIERGGGYQIEVTLEICYTSIVKIRLLDTQKAIELGLDGTSKLEGSWGVTSYTLEEFGLHGVRSYPADTTILEAESWPDFTLEYANAGYELWTWQDGSTAWQIQYLASGFGKAPCGHTATIEIAKIGGGAIYHICNDFKESNTDMSDFVATVLKGMAQYPFTGDVCLGKTCKFYQEMNSVDSTS